jgi:hypothetical protein
MYDNYLNNAKQYISAMYGITFPLTGKTYLLKRDAVTYTAGNNNDLIPNTTLPAGTAITISNVVSDPSNNGKTYAQFTNNGTAFYVDYVAFNPTPVQLPNKDNTDIANSTNSTDSTDSTDSTSATPNNNATGHRSWLNALLPGNKGKTGINWLLIDLAVIAAGAIVIKKVSKRKPKNPNYIVLKP